MQEIPSPPEANDEYHFVIISNHRWCQSSRIFSNHLQKVLSIGPKFDLCAMQDVGVNILEVFPWYYIYWFLLIRYDLKKQHNAQLDKRMWWQILSHPWKSTKMMTTCPESSSSIAGISSQNRQQGIKWASLFLPVASSSWI